MDKMWNCARWKYLDLLFILCLSYLCLSTVSAQGKRTFYSCIIIFFLIRKNVPPPKPKEYFWQICYLLENTR